MSELPFNLDDVLHRRTVENARIEFKKSINDLTRDHIGATMCAFANDYYNLNGGWIVIGIEAPDGEPVFPPAGIDPSNVEKTQQEIRVLGRKIIPPYHPAVFTTDYEGKNLVIAYAPAGDERPYMTNDPRNPQNKEYFIREGAETVKADNRTRETLIQLCAKTPFDDRLNTNANLDDINSTLVREYLVSVRSNLIESSKIDLEVFKSMRIVDKIHDTYKPKNVGLLFFNYNPDKFLSGCKFEIAQFHDISGGDIIEERTFSGPINRQTADVISYLNSLSPSQLRKTGDKAEVEKFHSYPYEALEEAIINATYHRDYGSSVEPNKIYLYPDRLEIISYPGPVPGINMSDFEKDSPLSPVPLRNRRMGEFLKELRLAEMRSTGIPKIKKSMRENGSGEPQFIFDADRTFFKVVLPAHPKYFEIHVLREASYRWSTGERDVAKNMLRSSIDRNPGSGMIAGQLIDYYCNTDEYKQANDVFLNFHKSSTKSEVEQPYIRYFRCLIGNQKQKAKEVIDLLDPISYYDNPIDIAIAFKRLNEPEKAHLILSRLINQYPDNFNYLRNFAEVKIDLANQIFYSRSPVMSTVKRLQREALDLLNRAIPLATDSTAKAWCYFNLGRLRSWLRMPNHLVEEAFRLAMEEDPSEGTFSDRYKNFTDKIQ
ncbi:MAG: RNA-binding domain-containing protein [Dehalococcoidales bacterium]